MISNGTQRITAFIVHTDGLTNYPTERRKNRPAMNVIILTPFTQKEKLQLLQLMYHLLQTRMCAMT